MNVIFSSGWSFVSLFLSACVYQCPPLLCTQNSQQNGINPILRHNFLQLFISVYLDIQIVPKLTTEKYKRKIAVANGFSLFSRWREWGGRRELRKVLSWQKANSAEKNSNNKNQNSSSSSGSYNSSIEPYSYSNNLFHVKSLHSGYYKSL